MLSIKKITLIKFDYSDVIVQSVYVKVLKKRMKRRRNGREAQRSIP
jgi:hypothetical protein